MTLYTLINDIGARAIANNLINWYGGGGSIYELSSLTIKDYSLIYISPTGSHTVTDNYTRFHLTVFYVDRLLDDNSNDVQIFSTGVEVLKNIIKDMENISDVLEISDNYTIENFTETSKLADRCAGAYATIDVTVTNNNNC